jgi:hypothetical protein
MGRVFTIAFRTIAAAVVLALLVPSTGAGATQRVVERRRLADGVIYRQVNDPAIPVRMYVVELTPGTPATLDQVLAAPRMGTFARTSTLGKDAGALVAINGGYQDWPARPHHQYVRDGKVIQTGQGPGHVFGFRRDEMGAWIRTSRLQVAATNLVTDEQAPIDAWNTGGPGPGEVVAYGPYGGAYERPSAKRCSARLAKRSALRWNPDEEGTNRVYVVDRVLCSETSALEVRRGTVVLSSRLSGSGAVFVGGLHAGDRVRVSWSNRMPGVLDQISGDALIVHDGKVRYEAGCTLQNCYRNPRTAIGITGDGHVILFVADGRSPASVGLTFNELGRELVALGVVEAVNLDGGGSATMWIEGLGIVNHPCDPSGERAVTDAVVILPGADAGEPSPRPARLA